MSAEQRRMPNIQLLQGELEQNMQVLRVIVDRKLNWRAHVNSAVAKVTRVEAAIRRITASLWGTSLRRSRQLYVAMARPAMMYGCECWMPGGTLQADLVQKLNVAQNKILRVATGAYKATSTAALRWETGVEDVRVYARQKSITTTATQIGEHTTGIFQELRNRVARRCEQLSIMPRRQQRTRDTEHLVASQLRISTALQHEEPEIASKTKKERKKAKAHPRPESS